jgi:SAM-dependent methyltransferase
MKVHFCTFGNTNSYHKSLERIASEAVKSNFFDSVECYNESHLPTDVRRYCELNSTGFGHWIWKPYIIFNSLSKISEGDILVYADAGSTINATGIKRFKSYLHALKITNNDLLAFELRDNPVILKQNKHWIKGDLIRHFNAESLLEASHLCAGVMFIKKNERTTNFIKQWYETGISNPDFLTTGPSKFGNDYEGFLRNHSDQAIFSLLCRQFTVGYISAAEILPELNNNEISKMAGFPIIATRISDQILANSPSLKDADKKFINESLSVVANHFIRLALNHLDHKLYDISNQMADVRQMLIRNQVGNPSINLFTDYALAFNSKDHLHPWGTRNDNTRSSRFCSACERQFKGRPLSFLDLGCSGGGLVFDFLVRGHQAIGLEGSDFSLKNQRAEWRTIPNFLKTCDITKPFRLTDSETEQFKHFDVISIWEVLEHIHRNDLPMLFANVRNHLKSDGVFIGSIALRDDIVDGVNYHQTVMHQEWWANTFQANGLQFVDDHEFNFHDFCRGTGNGPMDPNFSTEPDAGFHFVAKLI